MRNVMTAAAGLAIFFGTACSSSTTPPTSEGTTGPVGAGATTGTNGTGSGGVAGTNNGGTTGKPSLLIDGAECTSNLSCQSSVCGLDGTGHCCTTKCKTDDAACAATGDCDSNGACNYPAAGGPCNSSCQYGLFISSLCDGNGACSAQKPVACPDNLACNAGGTACQGTCNPANGTADCSLGWWCNAGTCTPQVQLGACTSNSECQSNVCGVTGVGHCCTQTACLNTTAPCGTADCDGATGACTFGDTTVSCDTGPVSCQGDNQLDPNTFCDGVGACVPPIQTNCSPYACEPAAGGCVTSCTSIADCAKDFYCNGGICIPQNAIGTCTENDACLSFQCGANGSGNCCFVACGNTDPACGITGCDVNDGSCQYPGNAQACGSILESCAGHTQQDPSVCDGVGNCPKPGTTDCTPFICGATACLTSCSGNSDCVTGDVCDTGHAVCCPTIVTGGTMNVDNSSGDDTAACCGMPGYTECKTISKAMTIIDAAQATGVTINAYIGGVGNGGDWVFTGTGPYFCNGQPANANCNPSLEGGEPIPITLGWGVELNAPGVNFAPNWYNLGYGCDPGSYNNCFTEGAEIIDVAAYSANDTTGYASIVGSDSNGAGQVQIGLSSTNHVYDTMYQAAVRVETGEHLYIANANASTYYYARYYYSPYTGSAIIVSPGASLTFGADKSGANTGTVTLGSTSYNNSQNWGYIGLTCQTDGVSQGCTVNDVVQDGGSNSVVIAGEYWGPDIDAEDFANITLVGNPQIGMPPSSQGFLNCKGKIDGEFNSSYYSNDVGNQMIWLNGQASIDFENGTVECLDGDAFYLNSSPNGNGDPALTLKNSTVQNTEIGLYASAGTATVINSNIYFNAINVWQDSNGTIDLSGGTSKTSNTVECTSRGESRWFQNSCYGYDKILPSTNVLNTTGNDLNASNVAWETKGPDVFSCDSALDSCTCEIAACTNAGADDDMDAVYTSTGTITTTGATQSSVVCTQPTLCGCIASCAAYYGSTQYVCCHYPYSPTTNPFCEYSPDCPNGSYYYQSYD